MRIKKNILIVICLFLVVSFGAVDTAWAQNSKASQETKHKSKANLPSINFHPNVRIMVLKQNETGYKLWWEYNENRKTIVVSEEYMKVDESSSSSSPQHYVGHVLGEEGLTNEISYIGY